MHLSIRLEIHDWLADGYPLVGLIHGHELGVVDGGDAIGRRPA